MVSSHTDANQLVSGKLRQRTIVYSQCEHWTYPQVWHYQYFDWEPLFKKRHFIVYRYKCFQMIENHQTISYYIKVRCYMLFSSLYFRRIYDILYRYSFYTRIFQKKILKQIYFTWYLILPTIANKWTITKLHRNISLFISIVSTEEPGRRRVSAYWTRLEYCC